MSIELQVLLRQRQIIDQQVQQLIGTGNRVDMPLSSDIGRYIVEELLASDPVLRQTKFPDFDENRKAYRIITRQVRNDREASLLIGRASQLLEFNSTVVMTFSSTYQLLRCIHLDRGLIKDIFYDELHSDRDKTVRLDAVYRHGNYSDLTDGAREIWNRTESTNRFERACIVGTSAGWCWYLGCTTCGNHELRLALSDIAKGMPVRHPEDGRHNPRPPADQLDSRELGRLYDVCARADLMRIAKGSRFPDWLGYMGVVMQVSRTRDRDYTRLCDSWSKQLLGMIERTSQAYDRLKLCNQDAAQNLEISDLELCQSGMREEFINRG